MFDSLHISRLFENVLNNDMQQYGISPEAIKFGIECMAHVYKGETVGLRAERSKIADYRDPAHRCAYLHKYAVLHTTMVRDMLFEAIHENYNFFHRLVFSRGQFRICSLGGGPGTDVIGAMSAFHAAFSYFETSVTVVDYMAEWSYSFDSILKELGSGWYGAFGNNISHCLNWQYVGANLLKSFKPEVNEALSSASLVTMIKFTSAAACKDTYSMIRNIFIAMKPGAMLMFIDNDGGGFHQLIMDAAIEFDFRSIFGPHRHENYINKFCKKRFGYSSCNKTTVSVHMLQKPVMFNPCDNFSNASAYPYMPENRRVILKNDFVSTRSPPTPFLYLGQSPDENCNFRPTRPPLLESSPAPFTPRNQHLSINNRLGYASADQVKLDFSYDENISKHHGFISSLEEIPQSPHYAIVPFRIATPLSHIVNSPLNDRNERPAIYTPDSQPRGGKRARMQGCFPLKKFRHHLEKKVNQVKARARLVFKKKYKKEKTHPIFQL